MGRVRYRTDDLQPKLPDKPEPHVLVETGGVQQDYLQQAEPAATPGRAARRAYSVSGVEYGDYFPSWPSRGSAGLQRIYTGQRNTVWWSAERPSGRPGHQLE